MLDNLLTFLLPVASYGLFRASAVAVALTTVNGWMGVPIILSVVYIWYVLKDTTRPLLATIREDSVVRTPMH